MVIPFEYCILVLSIAISIIVDFFKLHELKKIKKHGFVILIKIFLVSFEFMSIKFGLNIIECVSNIGVNICSFSELNTLIFSIGVAFIIIGLIGYIITLTTLKLKDLTKEI